LHCFYHQTQDAVAICRSCGKGLCPKCAIEIADTGVACKDRCEEKAKAINELIARSKAISRSPFLSVVYLLLGLGCLTMAYVDRSAPLPSILFAATGIYLISGGIYYIVATKKHS